MKFIITAFTNYSIIKINNKFNVNNIFSKMVPTPREISSDCGMALLIDSEKKETVTNILDEVREEIDKIYYEKNKKYIEFKGE